MDKEILAVIGKLYLDVIGLNNYIEALKNKISELESEIEEKSVSKK